MSSSVIVARSIRTQRLAIVTRSFGTSSARTTNTVPAGGSSMVLSNFGAAVVTRWNSSRINTFGPFSIDDRAAVAMIVSACSAEIDAPTRSNSVMSAWFWVRAMRACRTASSPVRSRLTSAAANARANSRFPLPRGPTSKYACTGALTPARNSPTASS